MKRMSTVELQIAERARKFKGEALHSLYNFIDAPLLQESYDQLNKKSAGGIDGKTWLQYGLEFPERRNSLLEEFKSGRYRAPAIRRVYIRKDKHSQRPLGIPTIEDKVLQASVRKVIEPIYEEDFKPFSYGFRPGRSQHQAIEFMFQKVSFEKMHYIIDADIKNYFGSINHGILREFLDKRVKDGVIRRMIDKWLKAGTMESGNISYPDHGTQQGSVISPILSNIYLHYVLDEWFSEQIQPLLKGKSFIVRYADDFILGFTDKSDAERVMEVLPKRFAKYELTLHPEKTKLIDLNSKRGGTGRSFDFLGFTHYLGKSRNGSKVLKRKTSSKSMTKAVVSLSEFIKQNRHMKLNELISAINVKLRGHYSYYGYTFNFRGISRFYELICRSLFKWLNRRGGKPVLEWDRFTQIVNTWVPLIKPSIHHSYGPSLRN
ncbi:MAG: group II intron reverse transcriptase/maturase [Bacteroidales bacterium]|nr:group II intron reverse transcriptase/maturase [Bacteroidales bacterium]